MNKKPALFILLIALTACSTQPDWLVKKRHYDGHTSIHSREVGEYQFNWDVAGDVAVRPVQVFTVSDEIWIQWQPMQMRPRILAQEEKGQAKEVTAHQQGRYSIIPQDDYTTLYFKGPQGQQAVAVQQPNG